MEELKQFKQLLTSSRSVVGRVSVRSALNPVLWAVAVFSVPCMGAYGLTGRDIFWEFALIPVTLLAAGFLFLLFFDRDRLQSENYQLEKRAMDVLGDSQTQHQITGEQAEELPKSEAPELKAKSQK